MRTRTWTRPIAALAGGLLVLGLAACGDDDDSDADAPEETTTAGVDDTLPSGEDETRPAGEDGAATLTAADNEYDTDTLTVAPGATVTFVNSGSNPHTMTADDDAFDTGTISGGAQAEVAAPAAPGSYTFHCNIHPAMTGTLVVE